MANRKKCCWGLSLYTARLLLVVLFAPSLTFAADAPPLCEPWSGKALSIQGKVEISRAGHTRWRILSNQDKLFCPGDRIRVDRRSRAAIQLSNETLISLDEGSSLTFVKEDKEARSWLDLLKGAVHFISRTPRSLNIRTPYVNAGIEGTEFALRVEPDQTRIWVFEGQVSASNAQGSLTLTSGDAAVAEKGSAPIRKLVVRPRDAVQWALYYPPVIDYREETYATGPDAAAIREALTKYRQGDLPAAFARLDAVPTGSRSARYYDLLAGLLLSVGQVDEARASIDQALVLDPNDGTAYALQSVIAVTQNDNEKALALAQQGAQLSPRSPVPQIALSYAHQALFDIEQARQSVDKAVNLAPQDALTWARLAELELSLGYLDRAVAAARKAVDLDSKLARTQTILGFANLTEIEIDKAKAAFQSAIEFDPADPLPRLGLGLAKIRQGDLDEGTKQIETAAILDPDNALIRSYLGKAYYEQKRTGLARTEFAIAKELDPKDPTPWFYDAILKQTQNQPVEALQDLQRSIELNANRAVYRSRLLLDDDLAARSASLGRIYNDIGFQRLGLVEGWKSLSADPSNYSAHRLLADNYAALPRHEIARVSELLQSQLLQPINITPVQPSLGESNLLLLEGSGPSTPSFSEFNPMFTRNRIALQTSGIFGSNNTLGDEVTLSGVKNNFSYSLGQFHFETDGFRKNNDQEQEIYNVFVQASLSPKLSVQGEFRHRDIIHGDLDLDLNGINDTIREKKRVTTLRLGTHYAHTSRTDFIISAIRQDKNETEKRSTSTFITQPEAYQIEAQGLLRSRLVNTVIGTGYYRQDSQLEGRIFLPNGFIISINPVTDVEHLNGYLYSTFILPGNITVTIGGSLDDFETELGDLKFTRFNPKFGITWDIATTTTFRAAAFRTQKRVVVANQTIEPTQVAGFNQFFDDFNAADSKRFGIAIDHRFSKSLFSGIESSMRDINIPNPALENEDNEDEWLNRAYLYWTPSSRIAVALEYQFEKYNRDIDDSNPKNIRTNQFPLTLTYNHPRGFFANLRTTFIDQNITLNNPSVKRDDEFSLVDLSLGYRLPNRLGLLSIDFRNIFNTSFDFQDDNFRTVETRDPKYEPERAVFGRLVLAF